MIEKNQETNTKENYNNLDVIPIEAMISGRPLSFYLKVVLRPVLISLGVIFIAEFAEVYSYVYWIVLFGLFSYVGWVIAKHKSTSMIHSIIAGGISGALVGFLSGVYKFIIHLKFYQFFQIITEPILLALLGVAFAGGVCWLFSKNQGISKLSLKK